MPKAKILLVEDNEHNWDMLSRRLRRRDYEVVLAHDGQQAVDQARAETPDLILMDINLPVMSGLEATKILRDDEAFATLPIIALTAHAMSDDRDGALAAGCDAYHTKPIELPELLEQMEALLATARA